MKTIFLLLMVLMASTTEALKDKPKAVTASSSVVFKDAGQATTIDVAGFIHLNIPVAKEMEHVLNLYEHTDALGKNTAPFSNKQQIPLFNLRMGQLYTCSRIQSELVDITSMFGDPAVLSRNHLIRDTNEQREKRKKELKTQDHLRYKRSPTKRKTWRISSQRPCESQDLDGLEPCLLPFLSFSL